MNRSLRGQPVPSLSPTRGASNLLIRKPPCSSQVLDLDIIQSSVSCLSGLSFLLLYNPLLDTGLLSLANLISFVKGMEELTFLAPKSWQCALPFPSLTAVHFSPFDIPSATFEINSSSTSSGTKLLCNIGESKVSAAFTPFFLPPVCLIWNEAGVFIHFPPPCLML